MPPISPPSDQEWASLFFWLHSSQLTGPIDGFSAALGGQMESLSPQPESPLVLHDLKLNPTSQISWDSLQPLVAMELCCTQQHLE